MRRRRVKNLKELNVISRRNVFTIYVSFHILIREMKY